MIKILIQIKNKNIYFKVRKKLPSEYKNMLNTNIISDNELLFSDTYIQQNKKIVISFINELASQYGINTAIIETNDIASLIIDLIKSVNKIRNIVLNEDTKITYDIFKNIIKCNNIKYINCYSMNDFMIESFYKNNILIENRNEILFLSKFMNNNNLKSLSSIFYKKSIIISFPLSKDDEQDFESFCGINRRLKNIHIDEANLNDIEFLIDTLKYYHIKNIKIFIHNDNLNNSIIEYLKKYKEKYSKKYHISFKIAYSKNYLKNNLLNQANINLLKLCCLIILFIISASFTYVFIDNYFVAKDVNKVQNEIKRVIDITDTTPIIEKIENENEKMKVENEDIAALLSVNEDSVGWLTVKNTNIDYSVVQSTDNEYYLKHDFNKKQTNSGWVFMDYRNNPTNLNDNTIFYAHNRYSSGTMFGTLSNVLNKSWYTNEENLDIIFKNLYKTMTYHIFSVYKIPITTDYLKTNFKNNTDRLAFYQMLQNRSITNFNVNLKYSDKIITLSTCTGETSRLVVHAVLVSEK